MIRAAPAWYPNGDYALFEHRRSTPVEDHSHNVRSLLIKCSIRGLCYHSLLISCSVTLAAAVFKEGVVIAPGVAGTRRAEQDIPVGIEDRFHIGSDLSAKS